MHLYNYGCLLITYGDKFAQVSVFNLVLSCIIHQKAQYLVQQIPRPIVYGC